MTRAEPQTVANRIETVVVNPSNIIETFKRNRNEETDHRRHVLRVSPPFEGDVTAQPYVLNDADSSADVDSTAIHLPPEAFVDVRGDYDRHRTRISIPTRQESRSIARSDHGADIDVQTVNEYHNTAMVAWEECVRTSLVDHVLFSSNSKSENETWITVEYNSE